MVLAAAFSLFRVAFSSDLPRGVQILALVCGLLLCGGVIGAAVGHAFMTPHGSMAKRGAIIGVIVFPILLLFAGTLFVILTAAERVP